MLARLFLGPSIKNIVSAGLNLLTTILVVRWFGAAGYAAYIVDLSVISLALVALEVIPSSYSVFRAQDDEKWLQGVAAQVPVAATFCSLMVYGMGVFLSAFQAYSDWMIVYVVTVALKRYLDIRLQSSGRLSEFLWLDIFTSFGRLFLLVLFYKGYVASSSPLWASLAVASLMSMIYWFLRNPLEVNVFRAVASAQAWNRIIEKRSDYYPYYLGIGLKRIRDNAAPLIAGYVLASKDLLAIFLLAYRGVIFTVGQVRIIEAMLNHRAVLELAGRLSNSQQYLVAASAQVLCLVASIGLLLFSGVGAVPFFEITILSLMLWPIVFLILERAKAYSSYDARSVNFSLIGYIFTIFAGGFFLSRCGVRSVAAVSLLLVGSEFVAYLLIRAGGRGRGAN